MQQGRLRETQFLSRKTLGQWRLPDPGCPVGAAALGRDLAAQEHVPLYGIYFDSDKADVKPESKPAIDEVARPLRANPEPRVIRVGHTDNAGVLACNLDLSKRRAEAVKAVLVRDCGIAADRLDAAGVGFFAPVASNRDAAGRAKNRRVEIVERRLLTSREWCPRRRR